MFSRMFREKTTYDYWFLMFAYFESFIIVYFLVCIFKHIIIVYLYNIYFRDDRKQHIIIYFLITIIIVFSSKPSYYARLYYIILCVWVRGLSASTWSCDNYLVDEMKGCPGAVLMSVAYDVFILTACAVHKWVYLN